MSKFKVLERQGQIGIRCKLGSGEQINSNEVMYFSQNAIRGIMQPTVESSSALVYIGAQGVPLSRFLKHIISKEHYFMIAAQLVEIYKTAKLKGLDPNWLVLDPDYIVINESSGEMSFIHSAIFTNSAVNDGFLACFNRIANATSFTTQEDYNAVGEFLKFINAKGVFAVNEVDEYLKSAAPATYAAIPHQDYKEPAAPQQTASEAPAAPVQPVEQPVPEEKTDAEPVQPKAVAEAEKPEDTAANEPEQSAPANAEELAAAEETVQPEAEKPECVVTAEPALNVTSEEAPAQPEPAALNEKTAPVEPEKPVTPAEPEKATEPVYTAKLVRRSNDEEIVISKPIFRIGKERAKVDYCITDNNTVSRVHATILIKDGKCYLTDNNSTNRTFINGNPVPVQTEMPLSNGDVLKFSNEEFGFIG